MAAMDCEMCQTSEKMEVTRVTVVDEHKNTLLDTLVRPYHLITDYHTRFSGITKDMMEGCHIRLEQVGRWEERWWQHHHHVLFGTSIMIVVVVKSVGAGVVLVVGVV